MKAEEARELGERVAWLVRDGEIEQAYRVLAPILAGRTPFRVLEMIGAPLGASSLETITPFLDHTAVEATEGGWVVIGSALRAGSPHALPGAIDLCRRYIQKGDIWYATDILAERVPGPAMLSVFPEALILLEPWREDLIRWLRRAVGVAAHFWAKRSQGESPALASQLLSFLEPLFSEQEIDALKGIGWGLKTLGKYYPELVSNWLAEQVINQKRPYRKLMLRKALTYLDEGQRARATGVITP